MLDAIWNTSLLWGALTVLGAGLMRGFSGFGSGMLMAPIFSALYGTDTVLMILLLEAVATVQLLPAVRRDVDWRLIIIMGVVAAAAMPLGIRLLLSIDQHTLGRIAAVIVLLFVVALSLNLRYSSGRPAWLTAAVGAVSGVMMAATSLGNPVVMIYLLSGRDPAHRNRSNITAYFALTLVALLALFAGNGLVRAPVLLRAALLAPIFLVTAKLGAGWFKAANEQMYRRVSLILLAGSALVALLS